MKNKTLTNRLPSSLTTVFFAATSALAAFVFTATLAQAQSWSGATSGDWLTTTNWTGGAAAGSPTVTTNTDIAVFNVNANNTVGINMNTTSGVYYLGAIDNTNATARTINNSSSTTPGILTLNEATVNSVANTILRNSTSQLLTVTNGASSGTMGLALGNATENIIQITGTGGITIGSIISGTSRPLTVQGGGSGVLTLSGVNTFTGAITLKTGATLVAALDTALGNSANGIILDGSASLGLGNNVSYARNLTLNNSATVTFGNYNATFTGNVTGTGALAMNTGFGSQMVFNGTANNFDGRIAIGGTGTGNQAYRMSFKSLSDSATANGNIRFSSSSVGNAAGSVFEYTGTTALNLANRKVEITSTGSTPTLFHQLRSYGTGSGTLTIGTDLLITAPYSQTIALDATNPAFFNGAIGNTSTPAAANTTVLAAAFNATPTSTVTLASIDGVAVGASISGTGIAGGTTITAINPATKVVTLSAPTNGTAGTLNQVMTVANVVNTTSIVKVGTSNWTLGGANTFSGTTTITAGKILMTNALALQNSAFVTTSSNGTTIGLDVTNGLSSGSLTLGGLSGAVNLASAITAGYSSVSNLILNPQGTQSNTYTGVIANGATNMSFTKTGTGTQTLSGVNTYTGATLVSGGKLVVNGNQTANALTTVAAGTLTGAPVATLGGNGTIGGDVTLTAETGGGIVKNGGVLSPTASASGTALKVTGATTFGTGSIFEWNMSATVPGTDPGAAPAAEGTNSGSYGQLTGTGIVSGTGAVFNILLGSGNAFTNAFWDTDKTWNNVFTQNNGTTNTLASIFSGGFGGASGVDSAGLVSGRGQFSFNGGTTSTLTWTAVPEPTSALAGLLIGAGLLRRRRSA